VNHANEHGARVRGLDSSGGGILAATQGQAFPIGPLAKLGEYLDPSRPHRDGEPVASRFLVSRKPILNLGGLLAGFADVGGKTKSARNEKRGDGRHLLPAAAAIAWRSTRKAPDPAGERAGAGKAALGRAARDPEGA
jgi:hypothetical protein